MMKRFFTIAVAAGLFLLSSVSRAAIVALGPPAAASGEIVVTLDTEKQSVNAIDLHLSFDPQSFSVAQVSDGGSIVDLWIKRPAFSNTEGTIDLSGIIPGGITTAGGPIIKIGIVPGRNGTTGAFKVISGTALLNDGKGTPAKLSFVNHPFPLAGALAASSPPPKDIQAPDPFTPVVGKDPSIFGGRYFLTFSATDAQSGIDHYEVLETPAQGSGGNVAGWEKADSPYLLNDQTLSGHIYVRAIDRAGNFREVDLSANGSKVAGEKGFFGSAGRIGWSILVVIIIFIPLWIRRKKR